MSKMISQADWSAAKRSALFSALSLGIPGWIFAMMRGSWATNLLPMSVLTGLFAAILAAWKAQSNKVSTAIAAVFLGALLGLAEGVILLIFGLIMLYIALQ